VLAAKDLRKHKSSSWLWNELKGDAETRQYIPGLYW